MEKKNYTLLEVSLAFITIATSSFFLCSFVYLSSYLLRLGVDAGKIFITITDYTLSIKSFWTAFVGFFVVFFLCFSFETTREKILNIWRQNIFLYLFTYSIFFVGSSFWFAYNDASASLKSIDTFVEINSKTYKLINTFEKGFLVVESDNTLKFIYEDGKKIINLGKSSYLEDVARKNSLNNEQVVSKENNEK